MTRLKLYDKALQRARELVFENAACSDSDFQKVKKVGDEDLGGLRLGIQVLEDGLNKGRDQAER